MTSREMQISFERGLREIDSSYDLSNKLDSDTIFHYITLGQNKLVGEYSSILSRQSEIAPDSMNLILSNVKGLIKEEFSPVDSDIRFEDRTDGGIMRTVDAPIDMLHYLSSTSSIRSRVFASESNQKYNTVKNKFVSPSEFDDYLNNYNNYPIIDTPIIALSRIKNNTFIKILIDRFSVCDKITISYICKPFDITLYSQCQLSDTIHDKVVEYAINEYMNSYRYKIPGMIADAKRRERQTSNTDKE